ncbi:cytochrome P450 4c3-like isoform X2 [Daphnia pulex]|uniref:cytochrome P450 4c3-like isoform X2 n=1 Tax=Daphnia pulex TaxID=6669 RepID=UPI001EDF2C0C|nr:cytochrome P450 4c3-like isoform X2 [Daphnia pulex]
MLDISWSGWIWNPSSLAMTTLIGLLAGYYGVWTRSRFVRLIDALPGPKSLPVLGNIIDILKYSANNRLCTEWIKQNGYIFRMWIGYYPVVHVAHHELFEPILSNSKLVTKVDEYKFLLPENCLAVIPGDKWRHRRRLLTPAFHFKILDGFISTFNEKSMASAAKVEEILGTAESQEINICPIIVKLTFDALYETSMGKNTLSEEDTSTYAQNLDGMAHIFKERAIRKPWLRIDWIYKFTSLYRKQMQYSSFFNTFHEKVIRERRELQKRNAAEKHSSPQPVLNNNNVDEEDMLTRPKERLAILDLLLKISEENPELDDKVIGDEIALFIIAGFDSSSVAMNWFLYLIAKHPEHQKLVTDELDQIFGDSDRPVTAQDLTQLKYLECCIKETLRLYPSIPLVARYLTEEVQVGDYTLPKDLPVIVNIFLSQRNPEVFPEPDAFKPERFLPENSVGRHPYAFIPFSAGPRNCIGQKFAMMEIKISLANILRRLRFSYSDTSAPLDFSPLQITFLKPKDNQCKLIVSKKKSPKNL